MKNLLVSRCMRLHHLTMIRAIFFLFVFSIPVKKLSAQDGQLIVQWNFDEVENNRTPEEVTGFSDIIKGNYKLVEGIKGKALKCDGFSTRISRDGYEAPCISGPFTIEAWVAPQAYPWNWCAIYNQEYHHQRGIFFGIDGEGRIGLHAAIARQWRECVSEKKIPFMEWSYIAATYDPDKGMAVFVNGEQVGELNVVGDLLNDRYFELQIARNHELTPPSSLNRAGFVREPASYSFDGIIDELIITRQIKPQMSYWKHIMN